MNTISACHEIPPVTMETTANRRNSTLRKTMSFDNSVSEFSQQSVVFAMERFSRAVANMDETVMVPCKLMDVPVGSDPELDTRVPRRSRAMIRDMQSADLHSLYSMLNSLKNELIWTSPATTSSSSSSTSATTTTTSTPPSTRTSMARRPSVNSMTSVASVSSATTSSAYSDSDSESGLDHESTEDSGVEAEREPDGEESVEHMANQFRRHLLGLHQCLEHMADAALYLTHRYQVEIGSAD